MVAKALRIFRRYDPRYPPSKRPYDAQALADNLAFCSRPCCRSRRRILKGRDRLPFQEVRALSRLVMLEDE
jgi:hypothetical protein